MHINIYRRPREARTRSAAKKRNESEMNTRVRGNAELREVSMRADCAARFESRRARAFADCAFPRRGGAHCRRRLLLLPSRPTQPWRKCPADLETK